MGSFDALIQDKRDRQRCNNFVLVHATGLLSHGSLILLPSGVAARRCGQTMKGRLKTESSLERFAGWHSNDEDHAHL